MKKLNIILLSVVSMMCVTSCNNDVVPAQKYDVNVSYESVKGSEMFDVPVKSGFITVVTINGEEVCRTAEATQIEIPHIQYGESRADNTPKIGYEPITGNTEIKDANQGLMYKVLMFEDSPNGDNDYNDVVLHISQKIANNNVTISIQPVAMGNTRVLKLGADFYLCDFDGNIEKKGTLYFSSDIKKELFHVDNTKTMINTYLSDNITGFPLVNGSVVASISEYSAVNYRANGTGFLPESLSGHSVRVNWFVEDLNGKRYYAIPSILTGNESWLNPNGYPYGIIFTNVRETPFKGLSGILCGYDWVNYPREGVNISTVYDGFQNWLEGTGTANWAAPHEGTYIDAIRVHADGVTTENSLFDITRWQ